MNPDKRQITVQVRGIVQGVGFRPFVYSLAQRLELAGWVSNTGNGVEIVLAGRQEDIGQFIDTLKQSPPVLAHITDIAVSTRQETQPAAGFFIRTSRENDPATTLVSPDIGTCDDCLDDIFSPDNRRYHYPFTNCTNCGPRLTIIRHIPYDRKYTSMAGFPLCSACRAEYNDPANRRFHAQPNACPKCGPQLSWLDNKGRELAAENKACLAACAEALHADRIVAVKGLGGFHLAVNALSDAAILRLRRRKRRYAKPLAVMARDLAAAETICRLGKPERKLLTSRERPIILAPKIAGRVSAELAPGIGEIGVMLPYTPLHHLLLAMPRCPDILVMTSGNLSNEPICTTNEDALRRLASIADFFLLHNRDIVTRVDDSVLRSTGSSIQMLRRSRGFVPTPVPVPLVKQSILACGAELKNTFCLTRPGEAFLSQHIGDLKGPDNLVFFKESVRHLQALLQIRPRHVACDLHPDYLSSRYAAALKLPCIKVQHHHAHAGAIMAEHGITEGLAVIFDGAGLGTDNTIWGGEFLHVRGASCTRVGHLSPFTLPGGDRATREIWRLALSLLAGTGMDITDLAALPRTLRTIDKQTRRLLAEMMEKKINSPVCSSVGRLFDGVAALLGIRQEVDFEGQAAMELEHQARQADNNGVSGQTGRRYRATISNENKMLLIEYGPLIHWLLADLERGVPVSHLACFFHLWLVRSCIEIIVSLTGSPESPAAGETKILLGGGCFQNNFLLTLLTDGLVRRNFTVYTGNTIPVNDGGIALGQAYVAGLSNLN